MHPVPVLSTWRQVHSSHGSQVISLVAPIQGHGGYDGPVASCSTAVQFSIIHRPGDDHGKADGLSKAPSSHRVDSAPDRTAYWWSHFLILLTNRLILSRPAARRMLTWSPSTRVKTGWLNLTNDLSQPTAIAGDSFRISTLQREDPTCITLHTWISSGELPPWSAMKGLYPELRSLWHHHNNLSLDGNGIIWRKRSSQSPLLQLLVPKSGRGQLFLTYHASLFGGHLGRNRTLARLTHRLYWSSMSDDVKEWLTQCVTCVKRKSPVGRHHPLGNIPTGHH